MLFCIPFAVSAAMIAISSYQEIMFVKMLDGYTEHKKEEIKEIPKGYYTCVDCGTMCKRMNASQKRCTECQKAHRRKLEKERKRKH